MLLTAGCTGTPSADPATGESAGATARPTVTQVPDLGWATQVVLEPETFNALMQSEGRERWIRRHNNDYSWHEEDHDDWQRRRALLELRADLQRVTQVGTERLVTTWRERGTLDDDLGARTVLAMAKMCEMHAMAALLSPDVNVNLPEELVASLVEGLPADEQQAAREAARFQQRRWETASGDFLEARIRSRQFDAFWAFGAQDPEPSLFVDRLTEVDAAGEPVRTWQDPCLQWHGMYALYKERSPNVDMAAAEPDALSTTLFSARGIDVTQLGLPTAAPDTDDAQTAREEVRDMDHILDGTRALLETQANADGLALLQQLRPLARLRQDVLVDRARRDLRAGHHKRAYATLLLARDVTEREIGVSNSPALFALLAEANLRAGRSREALDALQPLVASFPETAATREIVSDLVVLQGMDRTGDSKEH